MPVVEVPEGKRSAAAARGRVARARSGRLAPASRAAALVALGALLLAGCAGVRPPGFISPASTRASPGRVVDGSFRSAAIAGSERYAVYLPRGYDSGAARYPVIYALHGLPDGPEGYRGMPIARWGRDAEEAGRPALIVAPRGSRAGDPDPEWHDWGPRRRWESAIARELVARIDSTYRTIHRRRARALIGISAGGYGASIIGVHHPRTFSVIQSWSGYFRATNPQGDTPLELGSPEANGAASLHSYVSTIRQIFRRDRPIAFGFYVGDGDSRFVPENEQLHRELVAAGVPHVYAVYRGAHSDAFWAEHEEEWIRAALGRLERTR